MHNCPDYCHSCPDMRGERVEKGEDVMPFCVPNIYRFTDDCDCILEATDFVENEAVE